MKFWLSGRVVMQRTANPSTPVRFRPQPPIYLYFLFKEHANFLILWLTRKQEYGFLPFLLDLIDEC